MHNTKRGFRAVVFDLFGTTIYRPKLEEAYSTSKAAWKACEAQSINLLEHYRVAIAAELKHRQDQAREFADALAVISAQKLEAA